MTDETEHWLSLIAASPDDHHLRLVFADWLQDRDDLRCEAVRQAPTAEEALLHFPYHIANADEKDFRSSFTGKVTSPIYRPFLHIQSQRQQQRRVTIEAIKSTGTSLLNPLHCRLYNQHTGIWELSTVTDWEWLVGRGFFFWVTDPLYLCLRSERPTTVGITISVHNMEAESP